MRIVFSSKSFAEYVEWQTRDRRTAVKINSLVSDIIRHPFIGIGKPEPLRGSLSSCWSRRIDEEHRLVYRQKSDDEVEILSCFGHYTKQL